MDQPVRAIMAGVCTIFVGVLLCVVMIQVYASGGYNGGSANSNLGDISSGSNVITGTAARLASDTGSATNTVRREIHGSADSVASATTKSARFAGHTSLDSAKFVGSVVTGSLTFTGHTIRGGALFVGHTVGTSFSFVGRVIGDSFGATGRFVGGIFGGGFRIVSNVTHVGALIRPPDHTPVPIIKQLRAQQAALIQSGTKDVSIAALTSGEGGACDSGDGNGGYPMRWCNTAMDSIATIAYSGDTINRECTSYAYWYFTSIEGHTGFKVWGNAKDWAASSNYPTHGMPAVGAIAVETAGAYGHVAIVQALPGQKYAGEVVPAGYVLVSEMNYDWAGHFRYSYSPLSKFSAYIYP